MNKKELIKEIKRLKKEKKAIILAHNYQEPSVFEVADYLGDSFELAKIAQKTDAKIIIFAGVKFMAESAKLLNPQKKVLIPDINAICPMAGMVNKKELNKLKKKYPEATIVCYINTTTETKAMCDACVTSANAVKICKKLPQKEIIFLPDQHLASYIQAQLPEKTIIPFQGFCEVHAQASEQYFKKAKAKYSQAPLLLHPETPKNFWQYADAILGTGGMINFVKKSSEKTFLIGTEKDMAERLKLSFPDKNFIPLLGECVNMKKINLENIYQSLLEEKYEIQISEDIFEKAKRPLEKMIKLAK